MTVSPVALTLGVPQRVALPCTGRPRSHTIHAVWPQRQDSFPGGTAHHGVIVWPRLDNVVAGMPLLEAPQMPGSLPSSPRQGQHRPAVPDDDEEILVPRASMRPASPGLVKLGVASSLEQAADAGSSDSESEPAIASQSSSETESEGEEEGRLAKSPEALQRKGLFEAATGAVVSHLMKACEATARQRMEEVQQLLSKLTSGGGGGCLGALSHVQGEGEQELVVPVVLAKARSSSSMAEPEREPGTLASCGDLLAELERCKMQLEDFRIPSPRSEEAPAAEPAGPPSPCREEKPPAAEPASPEGAASLPLSLDVPPLDVACDSEGERQPPSPEDLPPLRALRLTRSPSQPVMRPRADRKGRARARSARVPRRHSATLDSGCRVQQARDLFAEMLTPCGSTADTMEAQELLAEMLTPSAGSSTTLPTPCERTMSFGDPDCLIRSETAVLRLEDPEAEAAFLEEKLGPATPAPDLPGANRAADRQPASEPPQLEAAPPRHPVRARLQPLNGSMPWFPSVELQSQQPPPRKVRPAVRPAPEAAHSEEAKGADEEFCLLLSEALAASRALDASSPSP